MASFDAVILCTNFETETFEVLPHYPLVYNHGQVDTYAADKDIDIDSILCHRGYLIPGMTMVMLSSPSAAVTARGWNYLLRTKRSEERISPC